MMGLSVDPPEKARVFEKKVLDGLRRTAEETGGDPSQVPRQLPFRLLCDPEKRAVESLGLVERHPRMGTIPAPVTLILDREGVIRWLYESRVYTERPSPQEILEAIRQIP